MVFAQMERNASGQFHLLQHGDKTLYPWVRDAAGNVSRKFTGTE